MWLVENWFILVGGIAILAILVSSVIELSNLPSEKQAETVKEWLLFACIQAEKELGGGTGQLKLRYVYDLFISRFPQLVKIVPFEMFSIWVDRALIEVREMLAKNKAIKQVVEGDAK